MAGNGFVSLIQFIHLSSSLGFPAKPGVQQESRQDDSRCQTSPNGLLGSGKSSYAWNKYSSDKPTKNEGPDTGGNDVK